MSPATPSPDCLTSLVGLSKEGVSCFDLPTDAAAITASGTGFYLDQVEGLLFGVRPGSVAATDLYTRLAAARDSAAGLVRTALEMGRAKSYGVSLYQQRGTLGGLGNGQLAPAGTRALLSLDTNARREGAWRITRLQLYTDVAVTDAPLLLDGVPQGLLSTTGAAGVTTGLPAGGLLLPLDGQQHTLEVVLPDGVRVRQNSFFSGCFGCQRGTPWFSSVQTNLQNITAQTPGNGFAITVNEECTAEPDFLCFAVGKDDGRATYRYPDIAQAVGLAIAYKAAALFVTGLLATQQAGRYTMLEPKALAELRSYYEAKLTTAGGDGTGNYLTWLNSAAGLGQVQHPCFLSPPTGQPGKVWTL